MADGWGSMLVAKLIDVIYEAAARPEQWPDVLQQVADHVGARGCLFIAKSAEGVSWQASSRAQEQVEAYIAEGWPRDPALSAPYLAELWPGFRAETHYRTPEEIADLPVHREFFLPRGLSCRMASVVQGVGHAGLQIAVQGFASHAAAEAAVATMDRLRPHLARAFSLSAALRSRSQVVVDSLALAGVAAAVISASGRLRSANGPFAARMGNRMVETPGGLRFTDPFLQAQVSRALEPLREEPQPGQHIGQHRGTRAIQSIAVPDGENPAAGFVIHLLPVVGAAREVCEADGVVMLLAEARNTNVPAADLLRLLFDLTPAEARLARLIALGHTAPRAAAQLGIQANTARAHLKAIYAKTGLAGQTELALALTGLGSPAGD